MHNESKEESIDEETEVCDTTTHWVQYISGSVTTKVSTTMLGLNGVAYHIMLEPSNMLIKDTIPFLIEWIVVMVI